MRLFWGIDNGGGGGIVIIMNLVRIDSRVRVDQKEMIDKLAHIQKKTQGEMLRRIIDDWKLSTKEGAK